MIEPDEALDIMHARFGAHPHRRALHAKGSWLTGTFTATPAGAELSRAAHLQGESTPVLARVSNGAGDPTQPDFAPDVRGLAVSFTLPDGSKTDMVAQSVPKFFTPTSDDFLDFIKANTGRTAPVKMAAFFARHPNAALTVPGNAAALRPIPSYANAKYFGVHAFRWLDAAGHVSNVRWTWLPQAGDKRIGLSTAKSGGPDFLQTEIAVRVAKGPVKFDLEVTVANPDDRTDDPALQWPADRRRVVVGTLELTAAVPDPEVDGSIVVMDPTRMTDGIELSDDQVLAYRARAYSASANYRSK
ncbi:catalase family peroxidase [Antrihabitans cavernicola]|uniref:Catalase family peroxidase n=1 Tax=Antrihabitans cavernicola TaxID=2495913 RepID=A0A5A7SCA3_9NOCA|nr:catalase family peroxidase [Spelaeibacter cavernicola]KAA0022223.1 catalase family peroxidase [Spelaeibacter cavernicola]